MYLKHFLGTLEISNFLTEENITDHGDLDICILLRCLLVEKCFMQWYPHPPQKRNFEGGK
jgi:hypothetical protein